MTSPHVDELLSGYLDQALTAAEKSTVENHLKTCATCAEKWRELKSMTAWMKKQPKPAARAGLDVRLLNRLESQEIPSSRPSWKAWSAGLATVFAGGLAFVVLRDYPGAKREMSSPPPLEQAAPRQKVLQHAAKKDMTAKEVDSVSELKDAAVGRRAAGAEAPMPVANALSAQSKAISALRQDAKTPIEWRGAYSHVDKPLQKVIRDDEEWEKMWDLLETGAPAEKPVRPVINFDRAMVVGVFIGRQRNSGYSVQIQSVEIADGKMVVRYKKYAPPPNLVTLQVLTQPYHLREVSAFSGPVVFQELP